MRRLMSSSVESRAEDRPGRKVFQATSHAQWLMARSGALWRGTVRCRHPCRSSPWNTITLAKRRTGRYSSRQRSLLVCEEKSTRFLYDGTHEFDSRRPTGFVERDCDLSEPRCAHGTALGSNRRPAGPAPSASQVGVGVCTEVRSRGVVEVTQCRSCPNSSRFGFDGTRHGPQASPARSAFRESKRRPIAGVSRRWIHRRTDHAAGAPEAGAAGCDCARDGHALQGNAQACRSHRA